MTIERFIFEANGSEMIKVTTASGATGYIAASIPIEALRLWRRRLNARQKRRLGQLRSDERRARRRQFRPVRVRARRRALKKIYRGPRRGWSGIPRR